MKNFFIYLGVFAITFFTGCAYLSLVLIYWSYRFCDLCYKPLVLVTKSITCAIPLFLAVLICANLVKGFIFSESEISMLFQRYPIALLAMGGSIIILTDISDRFFKTFFRK